MIRINLLTRKRSRVERQEKTQTWLLVAFGLVLLEIVALVIYHGFKLEDLKVQERKNSELTAQIDQSKKAVARHAEVKEKLAQLRAREEAIAKLQSARSGPRRFCSSCHGCSRSGAVPRSMPASSASCGATTRPPRSTPTGTRTGSGS